MLWRPIKGVVSKDSRECVSEWRDQVILKCEINEVAGIFGDQKYLDELDKPIIPIPLPVNVSRAGRLSLPSVTTLFNYK